MLVADARSSYLQSSRMLLRTLLAPLQQIANFPEYILDTAENYLQDRQELLQQLGKLEQETLLLQAKLQQFDSLAIENASLRQLLQSTPLQENLGIIARVINADLNPFDHKILLNKGLHDGIKLQQVAIDASGIVGVVVQVDHNSCVLRLLTDLSIAVPVVNSRTGVRSIANGTGVIDSLQLLYVSTTADVQRGDKLVTSGFGTQYPSGYPVGSVSNVDHVLGTVFSTVLLTPAAALQVSKYVLLLAAK